MVRIKDADIELARSCAHHDRVLDRSWRGRPLDLLTRWETEARLLGLTIEHKTSKLGRLAAASTTYFNVIRLGNGYTSRSLEWQCVTLGHELVHARQWRAYGRAKFRTRYIFSARWRWAVELQAYCESVRILVALGADREVVTEYIESRPQVFAGLYAMRGDDVLVYTLLVLHEALARAEDQA